MLTYLDEPKSAVFNAAGVATVSYTVPAVGNFFFPSYVAVSTNSQDYPFASCTVYKGTPGIYDASTYVDDTRYGYQDTSSMIAGAVVQYGQQITAVFTGGLPGDSAILRVPGILSDLPPGSNGSLIPGTPGTHFSGHQIASSQDTTLYNVSNVVMAAVTGKIDTGYLDVRQYAAFYLSTQVQPQVSDTKYNSIDIFIVWSIDGTNAGALMNDQYRFFAEGFNSGSYNDSGPVMIQDQCHAPFMKVTVKNGNVGADTMLGELQVYGATQPFDGPPIYRSQNDPNDSSLLGGSLNLLDTTGQTIAAAGTKYWIMGVNQGDVHLAVNNTGANALTVQIVDDTTAGQNVYYSSNVAAGAFLHTTISLPRNQLFIKITSATGTTYGVNVTSEINKYA